jgi:hypothetical protein
VTDNPYQEQTNENTSTTWLNNQTPVDVDLGGMTEYAKNMVAVKKNLDSHTGYLDLMASLPTQAWMGSTPEGTYMMKQMADNYAELKQYLLYLGIGLENIGMAAQTVADAFANTDGWSAATLNSVLFAFGDPNAKPPAGLPPFVTGKTYWDAQFEAQQAAAQSGSTAGVTWTNAGQRANGQGGFTMMATASDGRRKEVSYYTVPGTGQKVETTTVYGQDGKVLSTSTIRTTYTYGENSVTKTTASYDANDNLTGSVANSTTYDRNGGVTSESTTQYDAKGVQTSTRSTQTSTTSDGQVITTKQDGNVVREIHLGTHTDGVTGRGEAPVQDAIDDVRERYG